MGRNEGHSIYSRETSSNQQKGKNNNMKFCKALHKVMEVSDPCYRPYWTNYKQLKKLIKAIDAYEVDTKKASAATADSDLAMKKLNNNDLFFFPECHQPETNDAQPASDTSSSVGVSQDLKEVKSQLKQNPGEVAFFQLLYSELGKASDFFGKAEKQFLLREEIVLVSMEVLKRPISSNIKDRWSVLSKAVFMLYKDLLLLETFAIMTYFAFSKILKKHDKVTGHETRGAFMRSVVNKANFTNYPRILKMIQNCQALYEDASQRLVRGMYEDERLFLHMVEQLQQQQQEQEQLQSAGHAPFQLLREAQPSQNTASNERKQNESLGDLEDDRKPPACDPKEKDRCSSTPRSSMQFHDNLPGESATGGNQPLRGERSSDDSCAPGSDQPTKKRRVRFRNHDWHSSR